MPGEWKIDIVEVTDALEALKTPCAVAIAKRPARRSAKATPLLGFQARIVWSDPRLLLPWMLKIPRRLSGLVVDQAGRERPGAGARPRVAATVTRRPQGLTTTRTIPLPLARR